MTNETKITQCFQIISTSVASSTPALMWFFVHSALTPYILSSAFDKILFILKKFSWDATTTIKPFQSKVFESFEHLSSREHLCFTFYYICLLTLIPAKSPRFHLLIPKLVQRPPCIWPKHQISSIRFLCEGKWKKKLAILTQTEWALQGCNMTSLSLYFFLPS